MVKTPFDVTILLCVDFGFVSKVCSKIEIQTTNTFMNQTKTAKHTLTQKTDNTSNKTAMLVFTQALSYMSKSESKGKTRLKQSMCCKKLFLFKCSTLMVVVEACSLITDNFFSSFSWRTTSLPWIYYHNLTKFFLIKIKIMGLSPC